MPRNVAGKKARCNSCGYIFTVPAAERKPETGTIPVEPGPAGGPKPASVQEDHGEPGDWLGEFAQQESTAEAAGHPAERPAKGSGSEPAEGQSTHSVEDRPPTRLLDFADKDDIIEPPTPRPGRPQFASGSSLSDEARSAVVEPTRSYWTELAGSFFFFLDGGSLVTFTVIVLANLWTVPLSAAGPIGYAGLAIVSGYLCTFYMSVIKETAGGEDELPNIWIDDIWSDLVFSIFRFAATWGWVLLPATCFALIEFANSNRVDWNIVLLLAVIGLLFWPVVLLGVALGGSFHGLWPHTIVLTALVAPLPYLAMCGVLLLAAAITSLPYTDFYAKAIDQVATRTNQSFFWMAVVVNSALSAYAMIGAMRALGLYCRHYKRRFPWVAE